MKQFLSTLPRNLLDCFKGRRIIWHIIAIILTFILVTSGFDGLYFASTRNPILRSCMFPAVVIGGLLPIALPLLLLAVGSMSRIARITLAGWAVGQAEFIGAVVAAAYKAITGRAHPSHEVGADLSHIFHFGLLRGGVHRARQRFNAKIGEIFYKNLQSEFAVFQGTRFVGSHRPIMVVTANAAIPGKGPPLSEHFVFYTPSPGSCPNREVCRSTLYTCDNEGSQSLGLDFPNLMTIEAMISGESQMGRDHFANHVWEKDKTLHKQLFWPDAPGESFDFQRLEDAPLVIMLYSSPFATEIQWMLAVTENQSLRELQYQLKQLPNFKLQQKQIG
jgi:hypothetical protein